MRRSLLHQATVIALIFATGCATIVTGGGQGQSVRIASTPRGADVYVDDQHSGKTPTSIILSRKDDHVIRVEKEGHQTFTKNVKSGFNGWIIGNIVLGGIVGLVIDLVSGANPSLRPTNINAKLVATSVTPAAPAYQAPGYQTPAYQAPVTPAPAPPPTPVLPVAPLPVRPPAPVQTTPPPAPSPAPAPSALTAQPAPYVPPPPRAVPDYPQPPAR